MSNEKRNEGQLLVDVLGMESLVDEITYTLASEAHDQPTATAILGPFWRKDAPIYKHGQSIVSGFPDGDHTLMYGRVLDFDTGEPIENAELDVWYVWTFLQGSSTGGATVRPDLGLGFSSYYQVTC